jgi:hypothetical protein
VLSCGSRDKVLAELANDTLELVRAELTDGSDRVERDVVVENPEPEPLRQRRRESQFPTAGGP